MEGVNDKKITVADGSGIANVLANYSNTGTAEFGGASGNAMSIQFEEARRLLKLIKDMFPRYYETEKRIIAVTNKLVSWEGIDSKAYKDNIQNYLTHTKHQVEYIAGLFDIIEKYINQVEERVVSTKVMFDQIN